ncbi:maleylacetoacetate isomerase [Paracoccus sp. S1E-3]|uniref:maleylacetoacetate isomerase n=1 Tax=Paracoccus sp. S1E-3 TaxID=2756130 RepID=UPI0015EE51FE|nr:maleylacetoacetate isomerase [Paracoccus sp. S1E-3]MBA4490702.1 maleylacetoacetate isomerase [Paracoccus sp. S1E-3]
MKFYGYFRSSAAYRCRIAFNLKGVRPEFIAVNLRTGEQKAEAFLDLNPQGLVPLLDTGTARLTQSMAIIEWLDETHPAPPLLPTDAEARAHVRAFAQIIGCDIHPLQNLRVLKYLKAQYGLDQDGLDAWCRNWIEPGLGACEAMAAAQTHGGAFAFGDGPGLAEILLVPQMFSAERFHLDLTPFPRLNAIRAAAEALPAFAEAHPARQPDWIS